MIHELKTIQPYFDDVLSGKKKFEARSDDRHYSEGDTLILKEYDPTNNTYSGREITALVTYKLCGGMYGVKLGHCVLSIDVLPPMQ